MIQASSGAEILASLHSAGIAVSSETPAANAGPCRHGEKPHAHAPGYIHACHEQKWKLATWQKADPTAITWRPARCYSWRHAGPCARAKASEDYARIKEALSKHDRSTIVYGVLTLDPSAWTADGWDGYVPGRERRDDATRDREAIGEAYKELVERWTVFSKSLRRKFGDFAYVSTVECHRSGWPHLNVVLVNDSLSKAVDCEAKKLHLWGRKSRGRETAKRVFGDMLESAGFGRIAFVEAAMGLEENGTDKLAAYIAKLAGAAGGVWDGEKRGLVAPASDTPTGEVVHTIEGHTVGEIAKLSQAPTIAPPNFRRLRSSKGFLPPKKRDENMTGALFDENGREMGADPAARLIQAALLADTPTAIEAVRMQASTIEDKRRNRRNYEDKDGNEIPSRQPKIVHRLAVVFDILDKKSRGEPVGVPIRTEPPKVLISGIDGRSLQTREDWESWIGETGPGMSVSVKKYKIGNRFYLPQEPS